MLIYSILLEQIKFAIMRRRILHFTGFIVLLFVYSCSKDDESEPATSTGTSSNPGRMLHCRLYNKLFGSSVSSTAGTGSTATCFLGSVSQATKNAVYKRINYFRRMVGLNDQCVLDTTLYAQEQETALIMSANHALNHNPPNTWTCWTQTAANGAGPAITHWEATVPFCYCCFINDFGTGNEVLQGTEDGFCIPENKSLVLDLPMTRWHCMYSWMIQIRLYLNISLILRKGYVPQTLVFGRWTFGIPNVLLPLLWNDVAFTCALIVSSTDNGYGDNTLVLGTYGYWCIQYGWCSIYRDSQWNYWSCSECYTVKYSSPDGFSGEWKTHPKKRCVFFDLKWRR